MEFGAGLQYFKFPNRSKKQEHPESVWVRVFIDRLLNSLIFEWTLVANQFMWRRECRYVTTQLHSDIYSLKIHQANYIVLSSDTWMGSGVSYTGCSAVPLSSIWNLKTWILVPVLPASNMMPYWKRRPASEVGPSSALRSESGWRWGGSL